MKPDVSGRRKMKAKRPYMAKNSIFRSVFFADWFVRLDGFRNLQF